MFERRLKAAGYTFEPARRLLDDTLLLRIEVEDQGVAKLAAVIRAANDEAKAQ